MNIGFIGFGNMARSIVQGLVEVGQADPESIVVCAARYDRCKINAARWGVRALPDAKSVLEASDLVVLAVKPYQLKDVILPLKDSFVGKIVVSIAAGCPFAFYESLFEEGTHHISTVPNLPVSVGQGIFVTEAKHSLTPEEYAVFDSVFKKIAMIQVVDTELLGVAGVIAGCAPAFTAMYMEALGDAGVKYGLKRDQAYELAAQMIAGTGSLLVKDGQHPGVLKDAVCSPKGTTIRGVASLEKNAFRGIVIEAVDAIQQK